MALNSRGNPNNQPIRSTVEDKPNTLQPLQSRASSNEIINRFLVSLEESTNPENGLGYMIPFKDSVYFAISIEFDTNKINSSLPIVI